MNINIAERPVFVVGPLRSGTTLLRLLLDHHSKINVFGEFEAAVSQVQGDGWPDTQKFHHYLASDRQSQDHGFEVDSSLSYPDLIRSFLEQKLPRKPAAHIGASVHSRIDVLPVIWPNAKFIHILRDPRDVARSCIGMGWVGNVYEGARYWLEAELRWDDLVKQVPAANICEVRFESLVEAPREELGRICDFLGLDFEEGMLEIDGDTTYKRPDNRLAHQWRAMLSKSECRWVESQCLDLMTKRGYEPSGDTRDVKGLERVWLKLQSRWGRLVFSIRRWGFGVWVRHVVAQRIGSERSRTKMRMIINSLERKHLR